MIILTEKQVMVTSHQLGLITLLRNAMGDEIGILGPTEHNLINAPVDLIARLLPERVSGRPVYDVQCLTPDAFAFVDLLDEMR